MWFNKEEWTILQRKKDQQRVVVNANGHIYHRGKAYGLFTSANVVIIWLANPAISFQERFASVGLSVIVCCEILGKYNERLSIAAHPSQHHPVIEMVEEEVLHCMSSTKKSLHGSSWTTSGADFSTWKVDELTTTIELLHSLQNCSQTKQNNNDLQSKLSAKCSRRYNFYSNIPPSNAWTSLGTHMVSTTHHLSWSLPRFVDSA